MISGVRVARVAALVVGGLIALLCGLSVLGALWDVFLEDDPMTAQGWPILLIIAVLLAAIAIPLIRFGAHGIVRRRSLDSPR